MKKLFKRFRTKPAPQNTAEISKISKIIGPLIEDLAKEIYTEYNFELVNQPITYIVPAVWGASIEGKLSDSQQEIFQKITPVIEQIIVAFEFDQLKDSQLFAMGYLIRGLLISKITFMIEATINRELNQTKHEECHGGLLDRMETIGSA
jgi:hypothetical protein